MSGPISARITSAAPRPTPGVVINRSTGVAKGCKHLSDPSVESGDVPFQFLDQAEVMVDKESMMRCHATVECSGKFGPGTLQTGRSEFGEPHRVRLTRNIAFRMRRPLMPTMSEIADTSLMLASSRVFWIR